MPTSFVEPISNARQRTDYTEGEEGSRAAGIYCDLAGTEEFLSFCEEAQARRNTKYQAYGLRLSWDTSELDPENGQDIQTAIDYAFALVRKLWPNSPAHIVAHVDGKGTAGSEQADGGKLHVHCEVANFDTETGRALKNNRSARIVRTANDDLARSWGFCVPGETEKGFERWKEHNGIQEAPLKASGWAAKLEMGTIDEFERELLEKVGAAFDSSQSVEDFKERLKASGVEIVEVAKKKKNPETGKREEVKDESGNPVLSCWRYTMKGQDGRKHRRKDANLHETLSMENVIEALKEREKGLLEEQKDSRAKPRKAARKQAQEKATPSKKKPAQEKRATTLEELAAAADRAGALRPPDRPRTQTGEIKVSVTEVKNDLLALQRARKAELIENLQPIDGDGLYKALTNALSDGGKGAAENMQRLADAAATNTKGRGFRDEKEASTSLLDTMARMAMSAVDALLTLMMRFRIIQQQAQKRNMQKKEREEAARRIVKEYGKEHGLSVEPSERLKEARRIEFNAKAEKAIERSL